MARGSRNLLGCVFALALAGCSSAIDEPPVDGTDGRMANGSGASMGTGGGSSGTGTGSPGVAADACSDAASWQAQNDFSFARDGALRDFADALNPLLHTQTEAPLAVSNHMAPHCVWMVSFSASDDAAHAANFTEMFRHPSGLWTVAPQETGWIQVTDAAGRSIWIPIADVTGSAEYGDAHCAALAANGSATIPRTAGSIAIRVASGATTLGALLGPKTSPQGWRVEFTFSATSR